MRQAWVTLRHEPHYRSDAFADGLETLGFKVHLAFPKPGQVRPGDVVCVWNLNPRYRPAAQIAKGAGAALLVAENGYIPKANSTEKYYALARDAHNGSGYWFVGAEDRWSDLGQKLYPFRKNPGGHVLVCDQRGIGSEIMRCPKQFCEQIIPKLQREFKRAGKKVPELRVRPHPGRHQAKVSLLKDLEGALALVTWSSNSANEALLAGYPAFRLAPYHVNDAALHDLTLLPDPPETDRQAGFQRLAWAQWGVSEIGSAQAFRVLLRDIL